MADMLNMISALGLSLSDVVWLIRRWRGVLLVLEACACGGRWGVKTRGVIDRLGSRSYYYEVLRWLSAKGFVDRVAGRLCDADPKAPCIPVVWNRLTKKGEKLLELLKSPRWRELVEEIELRVV